MPGMITAGAHWGQGERGGTDDQLAELLRLLRKHVLDTSPGTWDTEARAAAEVISGKLAERLTETCRGQSA